MTSIPDIDQSIKQQIQDSLDRLPSPLLRLVLDFIKLLTSHYPFHTLSSSDNSSTKTSSNTWETLSELVGTIEAPEDWSIKQFDGDQDLSLAQRLSFLKLPIAERRQILERQAEAMIEHYQQDSEWKELMAGDIIEY
jgi:hypothetical protein